MNEQNDLIGVYRRTFASRINELTKAENPILDSVPFREEIGENFQVPVDLVLEQAFYGRRQHHHSQRHRLRWVPRPNQRTHDRALVTPFSIHGRASISYNAVNEAKKAGDKGYRRASSMSSDAPREATPSGSRFSCSVGVEASASSSRSPALAPPARSSSVRRHGPEGLWSGMVGARLDIYLGLCGLQTHHDDCHLGRSFSVPSTCRALPRPRFDLAVAGTVLTRSRRLSSDGGVNTNRDARPDFWSRNTGASQPRRERSRCGLATPNDSMNLSLSSSSRRSPLRRRTGS